MRNYKYIIIKDGVVVEEYKTLSEVSEAIGSHTSTISNAVKGGYRIENKLIKKVPTKNYSFENAKKLIIGDAVASGYLINEWGDVYSKKYRAIKNPQYRKDGVPYIKIYFKRLDKKLTTTLARAILVSFRKNTPHDLGKNNYLVKYIDGNKNNLHIDNLDWVKRGEK